LAQSQNNILESNSTSVYKLALSLRPSIWSLQFKLSTQSI